MSQSYLGIEIGGTKLQIVAGGADAKIALRHRLAVERGHGAAGIRRQIEAELVKIVRTEKPAAVGVGFGGPVDWRTGRICRSHQIEGWSEFDLGDWLRRQIDAPVFVGVGRRVHHPGSSRRLKPLG